MKATLFAIFALAILAGAIWSLEGSGGGAERTAPNSVSADNARPRAETDRLERERLEKVRTERLRTAERIEKPERRPVNAGRTEQRNSSDFQKKRSEQMETIRRFALEKNLTAEKRERLGEWAGKEEELRCANESTVRERIACRLRLAREEQKGGLRYLPEECRQLDGGERASCLERYDRVQKCRFEKGDDARFACVKERLNATRSAREEVEECRRMVRGNATTAAGNGTKAAASNPGIGRCVSEAREKAYEQARFRLYNLEEKAERLLSYGVNNQTVTDFIARMEELKEKFNSTADGAGKKAVFMEAESGWKAFVQKAKAEAWAAKKAGAKPPASDASATAGD